MATTTPEPDEHGRYRVRRKGDTRSGAWSTRHFNPEVHVIVPGPASDTYGNAWPIKPHRRLALADTPQDEEPHVAVPEPTTIANPDEESNHER